MASGLKENNEKNKAIDEQPANNAGDWACGRIVRQLPYIRIS
jgi:hypothetical protein